MRAKLNALFVKSFLFYILIVAVFIAATTGFILIYRDGTRSYNTRIFRAVGIECSKVVEKALGSHLDVLGLFADDIAQVAEETGNIKDMQIVSSIMEREPFSDLLLINESGEASSINNGDLNLKYRKYFQTAMAGERNISETLISDYTGESVNVFAVPVYSPQKQVVGVLAAVMPTEKLHDIIATACETEEISNYIVSNDGVVIVSPEEKKPYLSEGSNIFDYGKVKVGDPNLVRQAIYSGEDSAEETLLIEIDGDRYFTTCNVTDIPGWVVLTSLSEGFLNGLTAKTRINVTLFTILFCVVSMTMVLYLVFRRWTLLNQVNSLIKDNDLLKNVDPVTGFNAQSRFFEVSEEILKNSSSQQKYAVISVDINKFRMINDLHGHETGNEIITKLAKVIDRNLDENETFVHMSADLYYILLKYEDEASVISRIKSIIDDASYQITECMLALSIGIYVITDKTLYMRLMMDRADLARISAKTSNDGGFSFFDPGLLLKVREEKMIEGVMEEALESNEFKVYLQPKFDMNDKNVIVGAEALVRWMRNGELVPPGMFIPLFERNGFITKLDRFVFEEVCKQQKIWLSRGFEMRVISVNMSRVNLKDTNFVQNLYEISQQYNIPTKYFEIEITESVGYENLAVLVKVFNEIKNFGFHISIDDFGTGYSSLNMLKDLPADVLKIDRTFLGDANTNDRAARIIAHVISLAVSLDMRTICEGIETSEQVQLLSDLGCDMAQGYYFARPMPIPEYEKLVYAQGNNYS